MMDYEVKDSNNLKDVSWSKSFLAIVQWKIFSQGVMNDLGEEVLPKGTKYTIKMLN